MSSTLCSRLPAGLVVALLATACGAELKPVELPAPRIDATRSLMQALKDRRTIRTFSQRELPLQVLSDLLWAAAGVNRPASGKRTAPSAWDQREIDIFVFTTGGVYLYVAKDHALMPVVAGDLRARTGVDAFAADAPVNLVYVADYSRTDKSPEDKKLFYAAADTGFISQNVYLFCAAEGLATVVHDGTDKPALSKAIGLRPDQEIILAQSVGYAGN